MGRLSSPDTFGHNGSNCCIAWADPSRPIVVAYLTNWLPGGLEGSPHPSDVSDAVPPPATEQPSARPAVGSTSSNPTPHQKLERCTTG
jgi:CubicO group peptidase (beta-lactamase class C family)